MAEGQETSPERRRSSVVMYDPARDSFQPTPDALPAVTEERITEKPTQPSPSKDRSPTQPTLDVSPKVGQKRPRSSSPDLSSRPVSKQDMPSPPSKKVRSPDYTLSTKISKVKEDPLPIQNSADSEKKSTPSTRNEDDKAAAVTSGSSGKRPPDAGPPHDEMPLAPDRQTKQDRYSERERPAKNGRNGRSERSRTRSPVRRRSPDPKSAYSRRDPPPRRKRGRPSPPAQSPSSYRARIDDRHHPDRGRLAASRRSRSRSPTRRRSPRPDPNAAYRRRDPPPPPRRPRSPSPIARSPPREEQPRRRPGGGNNFSLLAAAKRQEEEQERQQRERNMKIQQERGVQHMSNDFYNERPEWVKERGRDWRRNESKIKGLRSFNNWIKSCMIQKFSPEEAPQVEELGWGEEPKAPTEQKPLLVLDIGCGKGGDLGKWQLAPQVVGLYVGLDPADKSIAQAQDRYQQMRRGRKPLFDGRFQTKDCFGEWIGDVQIVKQVGIDQNAGSGGPSKWSGGGFDVVSMMFSMHYSFENEVKARNMLRNVAGSLKKGGRFIGVVPNSDAIAARVVKWFQENSPPKAEGANADPTGESPGAMKQETNGDAETKDQPPPPKSTNADTDPTPKWGNSIYSVSFPPTSTSRPIPPSGIFRDPPFGWKYMYWMDEAVDVPEYVVPWEAFRALAEGYNLEQRYRKPFLDVWEEEKRAGDGEMGRLAGRMGVSDAQGGLVMSDKEREAVGFYHAFCFVKV